MKKIITMLFLLCILLGNNNFIKAQTNSVGLNGSFTFNSITAAYAAIGVVGSPQLIAISSSYTGALETFPIALGVKTGVSATNTITIRPSAGANGLSISSSTVNNYLIIITGSFIIIDGRPGGVTSAASNYLKITNTFNTAANGTAGTLQINGGDNCTYQYVNATAAAGTAAFTGARVINIAGASGNSSDNNVIQNCVVRGGLRNVQDFGLDVSTINQTNIIRNNDLAQFFNIGILSANNNLDLIQNNHIHSTSPAAALSTGYVGIQLQSISTTVDGNKIDSLTSANSTTSLSAMVISGTTAADIKNNVISNINWPFANSMFTCVDFGVNTSFKNNTVTNLATLGATISGFQGSGSGTASLIEGNTFSNFTNSTTFLLGINLANNGTALSNYTIRNNKISGLASNNSLQVEGIRSTLFRNSTVTIYNNFVANTGANNNAFVTGLSFYGSGAPDTVNYTANVYYNTINISGVAKNQTYNTVNSVGIYKSNESSTSVFNVKNNISMNSRVIGDTSHVYELGAWYTNISGTLNINYNTYYATDTIGGFASGWIGSLYNGLAAYQAAATPNEANSNFTPVTFVSPTDLHLAGASVTDINLLGTPIAGITTDIDNQTRGTVKPYRGADEASGLSGLTLTINFEACTAVSPITVELRSATTPYTLIESVSGMGGNALPQVIHFGNAVDGVPYFVTVTSLNAVKTWSATTVTFSSHSATYSFITALNKAYGSNQRFDQATGTIPSLYQGDVTDPQDGFVTLTDVLQVYTDAKNFVFSPYTDIDCSGGATDLTDIITVYNNSKAFIQTVQPPTLDGQIINTPVVSERVHSTTGKTKINFVPSNTNSTNAAQNIGLMDR